MVNQSDIKIIIPFLSSKFSHNHFKRMQINLLIGHLFSKINPDKYYDTINPKHIQIDTEFFIIQKIDTILD
jgi:hypothetical protein